MQLVHRLPRGITIDALRQALKITLEASKEISGNDREKNLAINIGIEQFADPSISNVIPFLIHDGIKQSDTHSALIFEALEYIRTDNSTNDDILTREARIVLMCHQLLFDKIDAKVELCDDIRKIFFPDDNNWNKLPPAQQEKFKKLLFRTVVFYCSGGKRDTITRETIYYQQFLASMLFGYTEGAKHKANSGMKAFEHIEIADNPEVPLASYEYLAAVLTRILTISPNNSTLINAYRSHHKIAATFGVSGTAILGIIAFAAILISVLSGGTVPIIASGIALIAAIIYGVSAFGVAYKASLPNPIVAAPDIAQPIAAALMHDGMSNTGTKLMELGSLASNVGHKLESQIETTKVA